MVAPPETDERRGVALGAVLGRRQRRRRRASEGLLPLLRRREGPARDQRQRVHGHAAQVQLHVRAHARRVPAPDPDVPRQVVRRHQHRLHADAADAGKFYTEVVSSGGGAWCNVASKVAGVAPFLCKDLEGGVSYTFLGGESAKQTAVIIAQEQAHLVGLEHTHERHRHHVPEHLHRLRRLPEQRPPDRRRSLRSRHAELVSDAEGSARRVAGRPEAVGVRLHGRLKPPTVTILDPATAPVDHDFSLHVEGEGRLRGQRGAGAGRAAGAHATSSRRPSSGTSRTSAAQQTITVTAIDGSATSRRPRSPSTPRWTARSTRRDGERGLRRRRRQRAPSPAGRAPRSRASRSCSSSAAAARAAGQAARPPRRRVRTHRSDRSSAPRA